MQNEVYPPLEEKAVNKPDTDVEANKPPDDQSKVKFLPNDHAGDGGVSISKDKMFVGMSKEELMKFSQDPGWVRVRWILLIFFCVLWFAMLAIAIALVATAPGCKDSPGAKWWQGNIIYQIVLPTYKDSDNDGVGDLKGLSSKVDYLKDIGVKALWLSGMYESPQMRIGEDIKNYKEIDSKYGTIDDFNNLVDTLHGKGIKLILDFIPNHTSDKHPWFIKSKARQGKYTDYYVWADGETTDKEPNNWISVEGGSAWEKDDTRNQYYYHYFIKEMPDLNMKNEDVRKEMKKVLRFWLDKKVDGFYLRDGLRLYEGDLTKDEEYYPGKSNYKDFNHTQTVALPESLKLINEWSKVIHEYSTPISKRALIFGGELEYAENVMSKTSADLWTSRQLTEVNFEHCSDDGVVKYSSCIRNMLALWQMKIGETNEARSTNWKMGGPHHRRIYSRMRNNPDYASAMNMVLLLLPGTTTTYYGEEISMGNAIASDIPDSEMKDMYANHQHMSKEDSRDLQRTPMQWNDEINAGFSESEKPWLPVPKPTRNTVMSQKMSNTSTLNKYKELVKLKGQKGKDVFSKGSFELGVSDLDGDDDIFAFFRKHGAIHCVVAVNFGSVDAVIPGKLQRKGTVAYFTGPYKGRIGDVVELDTEKIPSNVGVVVFLV